MKTIDTLMMSETGKKFPGQVHLSAVAAGGMSPVTHLISVGYESEAQAEAWNQVMLPSNDWEEYTEDAEKVSTYSGGFMVRSIKTWGGSGQ